MDFMQFIAARESCRAYSDKPVEREKLVKIAEAGRLAPSACNSQPWKFIVIDEPEAKQKMCDALVVEDGNTGCAWREQVPAFILLVEQPAKVVPSVLAHYGDSQRFASSDIGMAAMNMCYEATALGLSTCILGMNDQQKIEKYFGVPEGRQARLVLAVGYSAEENAAPRQKTRKPLDEVCSFNQW